MSVLNPSEHSARDRAVLHSVKKLLSLVEGQTNRIEHLEGRMESVETTLEREVLLTSRQAIMVRNAAATRIRELLPNDYKVFSKQYFSWLYREIYARFAVPSYRDIPRKELNSVLVLIRDWQPVQAAREAS